MARETPQTTLYNAKPIGYTHFWVLGFLSRVGCDAQLLLPANALGQILLAPLTAMTTANPSRHDCFLTGPHPPPGGPP